MKIFSKLLNNISIIVYEIYIQKDDIFKIFIETDIFYIEKTIYIIKNILQNSSQKYILEIIEYLNTNNIILNYINIDLVNSIYIYKKYYTNK